MPQHHRPHRRNRQRRIHSKHRRQVQRSQLPRQKVQPQSHHQQHPHPRNTLRPRTRTQLPRTPPPRRNTAAHHLNRSSRPNDRNEQLPQRQTDQLSHLHHRPRPTNPPQSLRTVLRTYHHLRRGKTQTSRVHVVPPQQVLHPRRPRHHLRH